MLQNLDIDASFTGALVIWANTEAYVQGRERVDRLLVTNDAAEHSVALIQFTNKGRIKQDQLQAMIQVVEEHSRRI